MSAPALTTKWNAELQAAFQAADGASKILSNHFGNLHKVSEKFQAGLVSEADRESEAFIVSSIREKFPTHRFLGEEAGLYASPDVEKKITEKSVSDSLWIIDPLDGTTNYVHQFPFFCISIGLQVDGRLVVGVVDAPKLGMRFHAIEGGGAFLNNQPIHVSTRTAFKDGLFATGFSSSDNTLDEQFEMIAVTIRDGRGIRRAGAAALDLCFVAQGVFDVFWEKNLSPWDTAAGVVIAREAGAVVTDLEGRDYDPYMNSIVAGTPILQGELLKIYRQVRGE
jgi:myo-inositol-1(or 4)-monophosphatase